MKKNLQENQPENKIVLGSEHTGKYVIAVFGETNLSEVEMKDTYNEAVEYARQLFDGRKVDSPHGNFKNKIVIAKVLHGLDFPCDY